MTILDTHAWIWWVNESPQLSPAAQGAIETANELGVHRISCWEVAMLVEKGRLGLRLDIDQWVDEALRRPKINLLPFTPRMAVLATRLPGVFHGDTADRFIVASCLLSGASLVTRDAKITSWGHVPVIW